MAASLSGLSASVTRILFLTGFPKELKTKDIQSAFAEWENLNGGFKIKWRDDTSLLIVFQDATVAKRAYLSTLAFPPPILTSPTTGASAMIKPYDGPDAQAVIQTVNSRTQGQHSNSVSRHNPRPASVSTFTNGALGRDRASSSTPHSVANVRNGRDNALHIQLSSSGSGASIPEHPNGNGLISPTAAREPSPTLPTLPSHPTLNSLINLSLGEGLHDLTVDSATVQTSLDSPPGGGPRIGDPGKRMLGAALGVRHPGLGPRMANGGANPDQNLQRAMSGLTVAE